MSLDKETGLMRKLAFYETDTKEAITITVSNIKKDPELDAALFTFSPPAVPAPKKPAGGDSEKSGAEGSAAK
jgi:outer membrane lipoprotein-sorting protein